MKFFPTLPSLTLFLIPSVLTSAALPIVSTELTPTNFKQITAHGTWFVEHFSPWCHHCKAFAPTWEKLVEEVKVLQLPVELAQVNCASYGDLCEANGVTGYPQMTLYREGEALETFKGSRELERLIAFLTSHSRPEPRPNIQVDAEAQINNAQEEQPPAVPQPHTPEHREQESARVVANPQGEVLVLDGDSFEKELANGNPVFVKFYAPWCGHCKKLAPTWKQLARHMQNQLTIAEVNCDDNSSLCGSQGVQGYPTLKFYAPGGVVSEYSGGRKLEQLKAFAEKASSSGVTAITDEQLAQHVASDNVVYLFLHSSGDPAALTTLKEAANILLGSTPILTSESPSLLMQYSIPASSTYALIAFKDHDLTLPTAIYHGKHTSSYRDLAQLRKTFEEFLLQNRIPSTIELTQDTFQHVMNVPNVAVDKGLQVSSPLVVLVAAPPPSSIHFSAGKVDSRLSDLAKKWKARTEGTGMVGAHGVQNTSGGRQVVFAWMDRERWGDWMKSMYGIQKVDEATVLSTGGLDDLKVVVVDHSNLIYWDTDATGSPIKLSSSQSVFSAIEGSFSGQIAYKNSENAIERMTRYLSNKLMSIEKFIVNHPLWAITLILSAIGAFALFLRRVLNEEEQVDYRKIGRTD
ncbi:hypothetical protein AX16_003228 [Volvariella volvacea WC 439]|nr:hypothetical protein AX16_003228 [Volvariella volvacea WC 439]